MSTAGAADGASSAEEVGSAEGALDSEPLAAVLSIELLAFLAADAKVDTALEGSSLLRLQEEMPVTNKTSNKMRIANAIKILRYLSLYFFL